MTKRFVACAIQVGSGHVFCEEDKKKHMDHLLDMIDWSVDQFCLHAPLGVKLIVGPELSTYGYPSVSLRECAEKYAIEIPGEETERITEKAKMYNCYIVPGSFLERDPESTKLVFNTQILIGPEGVIHRYRKYQPWWSHEPSVSPHDLLPAGYDTKKYPLFPVAKTEIGNIGGWICYDCCFPEIARELAYNGCEIFVGSTAYMNPYGRPPLDTWTTCCRARSIENTAYGVYAGSSCGCGKLASYPTSGLSTIVDFEGRILATGGESETITAAILDIDALRDHRKHARLENHLAHCRMEGYTYLKEKKAWTPQAQLKDKDDLTLAEADEINAKEIEKFWSKYYNEKVTVPRWCPPQWSKP